MASAIWILLVAHLSCLFTSRFSSAITRGEEAKPGDAPFQVYVMIDNYRCGGILYARNKVLTAAHCLIKALDDGIAISVGYGSQDLSQLKIVQVQRFDTHESFQNQRPCHDIAVITLVEDIPELGSVKYAQLQNEFLSPGDEVIAYGWGNSAFQLKKRFSEHLQQMTLIVQDSCDNSSIVGHSAHSALCHGDSGGPLVSSDGKVAGVVSSTSSCQPDALGYFTQIAAYIEWIYSK